MCKNYAKSEPIESAVLNLAQGMRAKKICEIYCWNMLMQQNWHTIHIDGTDVKEKSQTILAGVIEAKVS